MKNLDTMTKKERGLLTYLEDCAVNIRGVVDTAHINEEDEEIIAKWNKEGFIEYKRLKRPFTETETHQCKLSDEAWKLAHAERKRRYARAVAVW